MLIGRKLGGQAPQPSLPSLDAFKAKIAFQVTMVQRLPNQAQGHFSHPDAFIRGDDGHQSGDSSPLASSSLQWVMAKILRLVLTTSALWLSPASALASECVTISSNSDPSRGDVACKRVARSSTNGIGFWRCCRDQSQ
jgi:hypothetical protein